MTLDELFAREDIRCVERALKSVQRSALGVVTDRDAQPSFNEYLCQRRPSVSAEI